MINTLSAAKLSALYYKRSEIDGALCLLLIEAGYGQERYADTHLRAEAGDELARAWVKAWDLTQEASDEMTARRRWSGTLKPIRRG